MVKYCYNNFYGIFCYFQWKQNVKIEKSGYFFCDMYTGSEKKTSMPIGGLSSQYLANLAQCV